MPSKYCVGCLEGACSGRNNVLAGCGESCYSELYQREPPGRRIPDDNNRLTRCSMKAIPMSWRRPRAFTPFFFARNRNSSSLTMFRLQYFLIRARRDSSGPRRKANFPRPSSGSFKSSTNGLQQRPGCFHLFFGHFGVAGARVSSGQPLVGRCAEYPLDPLRGLQAQYVGLSHIHLRQQLAPRVWYAGSLSRCDYSE